MKKIAKKEKIKSAKNPPPLKIKLKSGDDNSQFAENIINTVREPLIVLDHELKIVTASRSFYSFFKVIPEETIGKLLYDLGNHQWDIPKLRELLETILPEKTTFDNYEVEHDFSTIGKRIMLLNARQIKRAFGKEKIILLAIEDITERKEIEDGLEKTRKELAVIKKSADEVSDFAVSVINTVREPLIALDQDLRVVKASRSFFDFFKVSFDETIGTLIYDLGNQQWNIPKLRELLETILPEKTTFDNYEVEHDFSTIGKRIMLLNARQIKRAFGKEKIILLAIEDITERRRVEESLSEKSRITEEYLNILLNHAHAPIIIWDPSLAIKRFNREFEKLSGYLWTDVQDKKIDMLFPEDKIDSTIELIKNNIGDENSEVIEINILTKDKDIKTVLWNSANILDKEGKNIVATIAQDITKRKRNEEALRQERDFSRTIVQTSPTFFVAIGSDGKTIIMNDSMLQTLGYTLSEVVGMDYLTNFVPVEDREKLSKIFEVLVTTNKPTVNENPILTKDGRKIIVEWHGKNILKPNGELDYFFGIGTDITERKRAEEKLLKSKQQYDSLVSKIPVGIYILHTVPEGTFVLDYVSPKMAEMFDVSVESLLADSQIVIQSIHPDDRDEFVNLNQEGIRLLRPFDWKGRVLTTKGVKWMHLVSSPELQQNRDVLWHGLVVDITERKLAEEKLQKSEELFRMTAENLTDVIFEWDIKENIVWYGDIDSITGYPPGGFPRTIEGWAATVHPEDKDRVMAALLDHVKGVATYAVEYRIRRRDGEWRWWSARGTALRDDRGEPYKMIGSITDITERKLAETALKTSEERYRLLFEESVDGILIANNETKTFEYANPAVCRMLGYTEEELRTLTPAEIHPKQDLRRIIATFESQARGDKTQALDIPCLRKDGSILYADINSVPILIEGRPYLLGLFRDITERKQAEEALRESEEKYKTITQSTVDVIFALDKSGKLLFCNESAERVLGYKVEEVIGKSFTKFVQKKDLIKLFKEIKNIFQHKEISSFVTQIYHKDGHLVDVEINGKLIKQKGKFVAQGSIRDITERKRAEEALMKSENEFHTLAESMPQIVWITRADGWNIYFNQNWVDYTGLTLEESYGHGWNKPFHPDDQKIAWDTWQNATKNNAVYSIESRLRRADGTYNWFLIRGVPLMDNKGTILKWFGTCTDINELKLAEDELRESEERFRITAENLTDVIYDWDIKEKVDWYGDIDSITGYPPGGFPRTIEGWAATVHPEDKDRVMAALQDHVKGVATYAIEYRVRRRDGEWRWWSARGTALRNAQGEPYKMIGSITDISERKRVEVIIQQEEEFSQAILDSLPGLFYLFDDQGKFLRWNKNFEYFSGYTAEEITHLSPRDLFDEADRINMEISIKEVFQNGKATTEVNFQSKDKTKTPIFLTGKRFLFENKQCLIGMAIDITERKQAEEALQESEKRYRQVIQNASDIIFTTDLKGNILFGNNAALNTSGYSFEEFTKMNYMNLTLPEFRRKIQFFYLRQFKNKVPTSYLEYPLKNKFGDTIWLGLNSNLIFENDQIIGFHILGRDITERKQAGEALRESEVRYRTTIDNSNDLIQSVKPDGSFMFVNPTWQLKLGYSQEEVSHLNLYDVIHPDSISHCRPLFEKIMSGDNVPHIEVTFITKDGKPIYLEGSAAPRLLDGKVIATQSFFHDITERKLSEVALREREQLFRGLFNASPMAIILMDPHNPTILWPIIDCNEATCLMNGFTREELIGHTIDVLNARQGSREESDDYLKKLKKEGIIHVDVVHRHKDGHLFPVEASTTVVTLGGHEMVLGIDHDITERKRAEESLRQSQSLYHSFIEQLPYPVFRKDIEGRYVLVNSQFCKLKGLKKEDFVGKTPMEVTMNELEMQGKQGQATKYADVGEDVHELIMRTGKIIETEEEYPGTNGGKQFMHVVRMPVLDFDGKVIGIQGIMSDISERKRAEEEITMLAHSLKSINECVSITDLEDKILFVNESYLKTYGYDENELLGKHISIVRSLKNPPELVKEILPSSLEGGWKGELWNKRKDGSEFMIYLSTKVINDKDGKAFGLIGVATDITERKRGEKELIEAKEKAEQSDKLKSEFLAQMSHEIRTPLNAIVGNVEYLNGSFGEKMDSDTRDCFDGIDLASKRIIRTVDLILNAAELQTSGYKPHFVKIDLTDILDKLYQEHHLSAKLKGLEITYTCKEKDAKVIADEYSTIQIFANLIDNAIKYTKKGKVEIHLEKDKTGNIMVEVKDSGIGISKEFLSRIFEPFTQEEQGYNRSFEGNGLGLALVKNYCNINNVLIEVESEKNVGSTFRIIFN